MCPQSPVSVPWSLFPCSFVATDGERSFSAARENGQHSPPLDHLEESFPAGIPVAGDLYDCSQGASVPLCDTPQAACVYNTVHSWGEDKRVTQS